MKMIEKVALLVCLLTVSGISYADILNSAAAFGVLGGSAVKNTGPTLIDQDLGVAPGLVTRE